VLAYKVVFYGQILFGVRGKHLLMQQLVKFYVVKGNIFLGEEADYLLQRIDILLL